MTIQQKHTRKIQNNNSNIVYAKGNIFDIVNQRINDSIRGSSVIIPHVCNNVNAYGAGFALDIANNFPSAKINFHLLANEAKLGKSQFIVVKENNKTKHKIIIANMISQNGLINSKNTRPLNYSALVTCMNNTKIYAKNLLKDDMVDQIEIHAPKFGSGLAGGDWRFISDLITDIWNDIPVFIYSK